jgi:peroxiredoxin
MEKKDIVQRFVRDRGFSFTFLLDEDGQVSARYGVQSHPMKFLIDTKGNLIGIALGYREWDTKEMKSIISSLINANPKS